MAEAKKSSAAKTAKTAKTPVEVSALPPVGSAEYKAMVLRGDIKE